MKSKFSFNRNFKNGCCIFLLGVFVVSSISCAPLRKKFTRKKKQDAEEKFIPVLDPIEYGPSTIQPMDKYKHHYSLWKVWSRDLLYSIDEGETLKRQRYFAIEILSQLESMGQWLSEERKVEFAAAVDLMREFKEEIDKSSGLQSKFRLKQLLKNHSKAIRRNFSPGMLEGHLENPSL